MLYAMVCSILFPANDRRGEIEMRHVNKVEIQSSWEALTDTALVVIARNQQTLNDDEIRNLIMRGDRINIRLGYNGILNDEFIGYVADIEPGIPVKIRCEDEMWQLKQQPVNVSFKQTTLPELIVAIAPS